MAQKYVGPISVIRQWTRNQVLKAGQLLVHMAGTSLPKAVPLSPSLDIGPKEKTTITTAAATDGTSFTKEDLEDFWYNSEDVWPPKDK